MFSKVNSPGNQGGVELAELRYEIFMILMKARVKSQDTAAVVYLQSHRFNAFYKRICEHLRCPAKFGLAVDAFAGSVFFEW